MERVGRSRHKGKERTISQELSKVVRRDNLGNGKGLVRKL